MVSLITDDGVNGASTGLFELRRIPIGDDDDVPAFAVRVASVTCWLRRARAMISCRARRSVTGGLQAWPVTIERVAFGGAGGSCPRMRTLYVSYDGVLEPLGESQVIGYLMRLAERYDITLLSYEKKSDLGGVPEERMRARLTAAGIHWVPLRYHKRLSVVSTGFDVLRGFGYAMRWARQGGAALVHVRSYVPAIVGLALRRIFGLPFIFDMRGFWADERVDAGRWSTRSILYRITKRFERRFFEEADAIVSLTEAGVEAFAHLGYRIRPAVLVEVIPTCADLKRFAPGPKDAALELELGLAGAIVVGCSGTMSNWYLRERMLECLAYLVRHLERIKVLIVTREDHDRLRLDARASGIPQDRLVLARAPFDAMPTYLRLMAFGLFFIKPTFSKRGSAATKLAEFLACGIPVVINPGVGDSERIVRAEAVGVVVRGMSPEGYAHAAEEMDGLRRDPLLAPRCRQAALKYFDLSVGSAKYAAVYDRLVGGEASGLPDLRGRR
jgi:glycosyltransferase involved in cell wall biosynthesis